MFDLFNFDADIDFDDDEIYGLGDESFGLGDEGFGLDDESFDFMEMDGADETDMFADEIEEEDWLVDRLDGFGHFHVRPQSDAVDTDGDGWSDALERELGTNPYDAMSHPTMSTTNSTFGREDSQGESVSIENHGATDEFGNGYQISSEQGDSIASFHDIDTDGDGFPDSLEIELGHDPFNAMSHPAAVVARHFSTASGGGVAENLIDSVDVHGAV